jgi:chromosome segregation ATPase
MPKKAKKRSSAARRQIGSAEKVAKKLARDSARLHKGAKELVGKIEYVESMVSRIHEGIEDFHDSTEEVETNVQNLEDTSALRSRQRSAKTEENKDFDGPELVELDSKIGREPLAERNLTSRC